MSWIKRLVTFGSLWPPIAMFVGATLTEARGNILQAADMTFVLAPLVYLILGGPALALGLVDRLLADLPARFPVVCVLGFFGPAMLLATGSDSNKFFQYGFAGLVATAICSLLAHHIKWPREGAA